MDNLVDGNLPNPGAVPAPPWSRGRRMLTPVPLPREAPVQPGEVLPARAEPIPPELVRLWMRLTQKEQWSSLVVVPAQPGTSSLELGRAIVSVGSQYRERPIRLVDAQGLPLAAASRLVSDIRAYVEQGGVIVTCIDSVLTNPVGLAVAQGAERALLCVPLGATQFTAATRTLELIGKGRCLGSVTLRPEARSR